MPSAAPELPRYALYAIRYATREARRSDHFIGGDPHDGPMPMDYFAWVAVGPERVFMIDTGFTRAVGERRGRTYLRCPVESLSELSLTPEEVEDVIVTHLHYDHAGNFDCFPTARFHLQETELHYAVGRYMQYPRLAHSFEVDDVCRMVRLNYDRRVVFHHGDAELAPGIRVHRAGGHSAGLQFVSVHTARGWVVLASDVTHFYENMETGRPFTTAFHIGEMLEGFDRLRAVAGSDDRIIPGHDPKVMERYSPVRNDLAGIIVRLDEPPGS
ncbi:N-acyl homoserine lactonase family protein [Thalassobaculum sp.]|uniref:N-acyl homoserine lactonase family protein n=1 Tax=Thalassobaculum sp. TaxID=2022740 RepID=UPI003B5C0D80